MSLRTDRTSGALTCVLGVLLAFHSSLGLIVVSLQRMLLSFIPPSEMLEGPSMAEMIRAIHNIFLLYLPLLLAGGISFTIAGYFIRGGSLVARRVAQATAVCGYVWVLAYLASVYRSWDLFVPPMMLSEASFEPFSQVFKWCSLVGNGLVAAAFPTGMLYLLSRPRAQAARI